MVYHGRQDRLRRTPAQQRRHVRHQQRAAAEVFHAQTQLRQRLSMLQRPRRLLRRQLHRFGDQQPLRFQGTRLQPALELIEQNAFVQGVLVDDEHPFFRLHHQVGVVQLNDLVRPRRREIRGECGIVGRRLRRRRGIDGNRRGNGIRGGGRLCGRGYGRRRRRRSRRPTIGRQRYARLRRWRRRQRPRLRDARPHRRGRLEPGGQVLAPAGRAPC